MRGPGSIEAHRARRGTNVSRAYAGDPDRRRAPEDPSPICISSASEQQCATPTLPLRAHHALFLGSPRHQIFVSRCKLRIHACRTHRWVGARTGDRSLLPPGAEDRICASFVVLHGAMNCSYAACRPGSGPAGSTERTRTIAHLPASLPCSRGTCRSHSGEATPHAAAARFHLVFRCVLGGPRRFAAPARHWRGVRPHCRSPLRSLFAPRARALTTRPPAPPRPLQQGWAS